MHEATAIRPESRSAPTLVAQLERAPALLRQHVANLAGELASALKLIEEMRAGTGTSPFYWHSLGDLGSSRRQPGFHLPTHSALSVFEEEATLRLDTAQRGRGPISLQVMAITGGLEVRPSSSNVVTLRAVQW
jgi:hypothetical protein